MKNIMINLVSEQSVPVVQFIKEFEHIDRYVFITTEKMEREKKTESLIKALNLKRDKVEIIKVDPDLLTETENKLENYYKENIYGDNVFINITLGTKLMAMATYKVFSKYKNVKIFYIPFKTNILKQIYPENHQNDRKLKYKIKLDEYLISYGIEIINKKSPTYGYIISEKFFDLFINGKIFDIIKRLIKLRNSDNKTKKILKKRGLRVEEVKDLETLLIQLGINKSIIFYSDIEYFTGGWFEEFVYYKVKETLNLKEEFIGLNYSISRIYGKDVKNEFDVLLIYKNFPIIIECKTSNYDYINKRNFLQETIYKLFSLKNEFGLSAKGFIFTLDECIKENDIERAKIYDIKIINRNEIINNGFNFLI